MPYLACPECGLTVNGRVAFALDSCPRCLGRRGARVRLEAKIGGLRRRAGRTAGEERADPAGFSGPGPAPVTE